METNKPTLSRGTQDEDADYNQHAESTSTNTDRNSGNSNTTTPYDYKSNLKLSRLALDSMKDAVVVVNEFGIILDCNQATSTMFGYTKLELENNNIKMLMSSDIAEKHDMYIRLFMEKVRRKEVNLEEATQAGKRRIMRAKRKDGSLFPIDLMINAMQDPVHEGGCVISGCIRDISSEEKAKRLQMERDQQEVLRRSSDQMIAYIGHEIRNPLHGMKGFVDIISAELDTHLKKSLPYGVQETHQLRGDIQNLSELVNMLTHIVDDMLDLRKLDEGKLEVCVNNISANALIKRACYVLRPRLIAKQSKVSFELQLLAEDEMIAVDSHRITQLVINLLSNAIKYTTAGSITVSLSVTSTPPPAFSSFSVPSSSGIPTSGCPFAAALSRSNSTNSVSSTSSSASFTPANTAASTSSATPFVHPRFVTVAIADTGRGIPEDKKHLIFQPFQQMYVSDSKYFGGTGLGLHLCQKLASVMGGKVWFESTAGVGSKFMFCVPTREDMLPPSLSFSESGSHESPVIPPCTETAQESTSPASSGSSSGNLRAHVRSGGKYKQITRSSWLHRMGSNFMETVRCSRKFLVVDDVALNRTVMARILKSLGATLVDEATNGQEALERYVPGTHDVILMDVHMPVMNGIDATRKLREQGQSVVIIGISASERIDAVNDDEAQQERNVLEEAGMDMSLRKPCSRMEVAEALAAMGMVDISN